MAKKRTINLMISEEADARLRALSAELKLAMGAIIEQAIMQWRPDTATPIECMPITDSIEARFNALESRLAALEAVEEEGLSAACEPVDVANVGVEPEIDQVAVKCADIPTCSDSTTCTDSMSSKDTLKANPNMKHDAMVKEYRGMGKNGKPLGITKIVAKIRDSGFQTSQERVNESLERLGLKD